MRVSFKKDDLIKLLVLVFGCGVAGGLAWWGYGAYTRSSNRRVVALLEQAETLLKSGDREAGIATVHSAVQAMGKDYPVRGLYAIKEAVLHLDSSDVAVAAKGEAELKALANDPANGYQGLALYYLWHRLWIAGDVAGAEAALKQLQTVRSGLSWASLAQSQIEGA